MTTQPTCEKVIRYDSKSRDYGMYLDGELIGFARTHHEAKVTLDQVAFERLTHGDCATATELDGGAVEDEPGLCSCGTPATLVVRLGGLVDPVCDVCFQGNYENNYEDSRAWTVEPLPVDPPTPEPNPLGDDEGDSIPSLVNWNSATASAGEYPICESCQTREFPPSCILPASCVSCANARYWGFASRVEAAQFAVTRQSLAIEARLTVCGNCQGIHHIQHCPEIHTRLVAEPLYAPRELAKLWWKDRSAFIARLASMTTVQLVRQVEAHLAYLQSHRASVITFDHLLRVWMQMIAVADRDGRGPAAPALRLVA
jgi:hypothetical protein